MGSRISYLSNLSSRACFGRRLGSTTPTPATSGRWSGGASLFSRRVSTGPCDTGSRPSASPRRARLHRPSSAWASPPWRSPPMGPRECPVIRTQASSSMSSLRCRRWGALSQGCWRHGRCVYLLMMLVSPLERNMGM